VSSSINSSPASKEKVGGREERGREERGREEREGGERGEKEREGGEREGEEGGEKRVDEKRGQEPLLPPFFSLPLPPSPSPLHPPPPLSSPSLLTLSLLLREKRGGGKSCNEEGGWGEKRGACLPEEVSASIACCSDSGVQGGIKMSKGEGPAYLGVWLVELESEGRAGESPSGNDPYTAPILDSYVHAGISESPS
jgi:hypothetical protein